MAYTPSLSEIRYLMAHYRWHGEVIAVAPATSIPQYPNPIRGDRYFDTTNNKILECRVDRRWEGAIGTSPTVGSIYSLRSTGVTYIKSQSSGWQLYSEYMTAVGSELGSGSTIPTVTSLDDLKTYSSTGLVNGDQIIVIQFPVGEDPLNPDIYLPMMYLWSAQDISFLPAQDSFEPGLYVPNDIWAGTKIGAWSNLTALMMGEDGNSSSAVTITERMPLDTTPSAPDPGDTKAFLTGPGHTQPFKYAEYDHDTSSWLYSDPGEAVTYEYSGDLEKWHWQYRSEGGDSWYLDTIGTNGLSLFVQGHGQAPLDVSAQFGHVYLVCAGATGDWTGQEGTLAWLDGDEVSWLFSDAPGLNNNQPTLIYEKVADEFRVTTWIRETSTDWHPMVAGFNDSGGFSFIDGGGGGTGYVSGTVGVNALQDSNTPYVVEIYIGDGGDTPDSMTVATGKRLDGDTGAGTDVYWVKLLCADGGSGDNVDFRINFALAGGGTIQTTIIFGDNMTQADLTITA